MLLPSLHLVPVGSPPSITPATAPLHTLRAPRTRYPALCLHWCSQVPLAPHPRTPPPATRLPTAEPNPSPRPPPTGRGPRPARGLVPVPAHAGQGQGARGAGGEGSEAVGGGMAGAVCYLTRRATGAAGEGVGSAGAVIHVARCGRQGGSAGRDLVVPGFPAAPATCQCVVHVVRGGGGGLGPTLAGRGRDWGVCAPQV